MVAPVDFVVDQSPAASDKEMDKEDADLVERAHDFGSLAEERLMC